MSSYEGVIIEESLEDKAALEKVQITATKIEQVTEEHRTPWVSQWTLHSVMVPEADAAAIADHISASLDQAHGGSWYADYKNESHHYIIYPDRIFFIDRSDRLQYEAAKQHGISLGIPEYQVDFDPDAQEWER